MRKMTETILNIPDHCDVAIIGAGPSGLSAATKLKKLGVATVVVLEREAIAGGIPRHCGHSPFGMREFKRVMSGAQYTQKLSDKARQAGVIICLNTTVSAIAQGGKLELATQMGLHSLSAKKVIICTGIRETPRSTRLVSGQRPLGIVTTGALQSMVYLKHKKPFKHPVIMGTELVSFSALLTCLHSGARPIAMLEKNDRITTKWGMKFLAALFRVPIYYNTQLKDINGKIRVENVTISDHANKTKTLDCDGVVFSGQFVAEASLLRMGHLDVDQAGNPVMDQFGRCSDPDYFATGNMTHPVETAGYCWQHGINTAQHVFNSLNGNLDHYTLRLNIKSQHLAIKYCVPQLLAIAQPNQVTQETTLQFRVNAAFKGHISLKINGSTLATKHINTLPERRIELKIPISKAFKSDTALEICLEAR